MRWYLQQKQPYLYWWKCLYINFLFLILLYASALFWSHVILSFLPILSLFPLYRLSYIINRNSRIACFNLMKIVNICFIKFLSFLNFAKLTLPILCSTFTDLLKHYNPSTASQCFSALTHSFEPSTSTLISKDKERLETSAILRESSVSLTCKGYLKCFYWFSK